MKIYKVIANTIPFPFLEIRHCKTHKEVLELMATLLLNFDLIDHVTIERKEMTEQQFNKEKMFEK